jgi:cold-inducible RNA-binding protein
MAKRLYVGNLPWSVNDQKLQEIFSAHGSVVSAKVISDKYTQRSKGFGFVEFENDDDADKAIKALNESDMEGRKIIVNEARPMEERAPRDNRGPRN